MNTSNTNDYSVFKDALGKRIQLLRTAASLTQEALAANSGLTRTTIVDIEKGATNPIRGTRSHCICTGTQGARPVLFRCSAPKYLHHAAHQRKPLYTLGGAIDHS